MTTNETQKEQLSLLTFRRDILHLTQEDFYNRYLAGSGIRLDTYRHAEQKKSIRFSTARAIVAGMNTAASELLQDAPTLQVSDVDFNVN